MAVPIEKWKDGMTIVCEVILSEATSLREGAVSDVSFTIIYQGDIFAAGWCFVPTNEVAGKEDVAFQRAVRVEARSTLLGDITLCATDIMFSDGWLSDLGLSGTTEVLHAHSPVRVQRRASASSQ